MPFFDAEKALKTWLEVNKVEKILKIDIFWFYVHIWEIHFKL